MGRSCKLCRKRYISASGSSCCPKCRTRETFSSPPPSTPIIDSGSKRSQIEIDHNDENKSSFTLSCRNNYSTLKKKILRDEVDLTCPIEVQKKVIGQSTSIQGDRCYRANDDNSTSYAKSNVTPKIERDPIHLNNNDEKILLPSRCEKNNTLVMDKSHLSSKCGTVGAVIDLNETTSQYTKTQENEIGGGNHDQLIPYKKRKGIPQAEQCKSKIDLKDEEELSAAYWKTNQWTDKNRLIIDKGGKVDKAKTLNKTVSQCSNTQQKIKDSTNHEQIEGVPGIERCSASLEKDGESEISTSHGKSNNNVMNELCVVNKLGKVHTVKDSNKVSNLNRKKDNCTNIDKLMSYEMSSIVVKSLGSVDIPCNISSTREQVESSIEINKSSSNNGMEPLIVHNKTRIIFPTIVNHTKSKPFQLLSQRNSDTGSSTPVSCTIIKPSKEKCESDVPKSITRKVSNKSDEVTIVKPITTNLDVGIDYSTNSNVASNNQDDSHSSRKCSPDICFICGASLKGISTGIRGRINHLKRCAKKYGLTAQDLKQNDDNELFISDNCANVPIDLTSAHDDRNLMESDCFKGKWHGNSETDLLLAEPLKNVDSKNNGCAISETPKQSSMKHFFPCSKKSLENVLMTGARNLAKTSKIISSKNNVVQKSKRSFWGKRKYNNSNVQCPPFKRISGTDFICDGFHYASKGLSNNYFLTHFHSDHYGGITKNWDCGIIFCSLPTATLVNQQIGVDKKYLHPLPLITPTVIESQGKPISVTLLDANHCPGSVMFLYKIGNRYVLHVGDFRWEKDFMLSQSPLREFSSLRLRLDELYFDTTYCQEKYAGVPPQKEVIAATIDLVKNRILQAKERGERILFLFGSYTIGKERLYLAVAERLGWKVCVDSRKFRILSALEWSPSQLKLLTTNKNESDVWIVPLSHINFKKLPEFLNEANKRRGGGKVFRNSAKDYSHVVGFRPTGWSFNGKVSEQNGSIISSRTTGNCTVHGAPYSEHSNFTELVDCLECLKPRKIIPTVNVSKSEEQVDLLLRSLQNKREQKTLSSCQIR